MKNLIAFLILFNCSVFLQAQVNVLNADKPSEIGVLSEEQIKQLSENKFLSYPFVDEKDIMWSKIVYEEIDLTEKFNHPLLFPKDGLYTKERKSLWRTIKEGILDGRIHDVYNDANPNFTELFDRETSL